MSGLVDLTGSKDHPKLEETVGQDASLGRFSRPLEEASQDPLEGAVSSLAWEALVSHWRRRLGLWLMRQKKEEEAVQRTTEATVVGMEGLIQSTVNTFLD